MNTLFLIIAILGTFAYCSKPNHPAKEIEKLVYVPKTVLKKVYLPKYITKTEYVKCDKSNEIKQLAHLRAEIKAIKQLTE